MSETYWCLPAPVASKVPAERQDPLFPTPPWAIPRDELVAFRYSDYDLPFWVRPNSNAQRWNLATQAPTQYWALTPEAAWSELIRFNGLTDEDELDLVRMPIWVCRVSSNGVVDLTNEDARTRYKLSLADLTGEDWAACQRAATQMRADGVRGILSPSSALNGAVNLTLFGPRRAIAFDRRPALASAVPAAVVAIGRPPQKLVGRVTRRLRPGRLF